MSKSFNVKINNTIDFEISNGDVSSLDVLQTSEGKYHILQNNKSFKAVITEADFNKKYYQVKVNNNIYNVNISNELDVLIKKLGLSAGTVKQVDFIKAPMPGLILEMNIEVGQDVKENDTLFILEAMKMENSITSPRDGIIKSISAKTGDAVEKNQLLIEFE
ncbi:MAG: acetyl-CoA carboxylase biotin carboxyl carrier protein subunit [Algibacter sp.]|uniref:acetyl-CoA carboxylase biotin carboxyl carrier protein subunit n=1 Tax=Algibacter sp. TaxID=1872428 RepID=UPI002601A892|nr:acetyl-CoA carboxylase biotin carboxyl carrier protein subunit [Algibacter sp.]MDG1729888.1 acetyl-CoA carboxylase biotin carboxyl carrier protein subunit [Algibacter sp.]MDG2178966.1 acetyl-CoA carboxylase biotin carboxyl carrier protein subunit [Algibacter sp.]